MGLFQKIARTVLGLFVAAVLAIIGITMPWMTFFAALGKLIAGVVSVVKLTANLLRNVLNAIHFHELLQLHRIAYSLAPAYRNLVNQVYSKIADVSKSLGYDAEFLNLALRNARAVVLSSTSLFGKGYDIAELEWWTRFEGWTDQANRRLTKYKKRPDLVFEDIDEWLIRDAHKQGAEKQKSVLSDIAEAAGHIAGLIEDVKTVRGDLGQLIAELPADVQKYVRPVTDPILKTFDDFYFEKYTPTVEALGIQAEENRVNIEASRLKIEGLDLTISKNPVKIGDWEAFEPAERRRQEEIAEDTYTAPAQRNAEVFTSVSSEETEKIVQEQKAREVPVKPPPAPEYLTYEVEEEMPPPEVYRWWEKGGDY